ncbi:MAG: DegT/DnrJ/EryC1/StrS family aminotransferase [Comamonadaceae bacterium]|jgi:UDP-2-acetamido-2-deoxy-ribo-hexuluronate aminotransferase|nr:DegT/DnrJ/EryC1/StrS family aminotransferase [Comamonadaceae bacterium]
MDFIDLKSQYAALRDNINARIQKVLDHGQYILGPEVREMEEALAAYTGAKHCISVASGTEALLICLMALELRPGDEVITSPFTFAATAEMIVLAGGVPVFVDIEPGTANLDATLIEAAITAKTRAIMPVSLYGQVADMDAINAIAARHGLAVIEDAAQSFGATYYGAPAPPSAAAAPRGGSPALGRPGGERGRKSCNLSTFGCTSFFPSKPLGCYGDGGAIFTSDDALAQACREIRTHGQSQRYLHTRVGVGGRMDTLQCAVVLGKLERFEWEVSRRLALGEAYGAKLKAAVPGLQLLQVKADRDCVWAQYTVFVDDREAVQARLKAAGIPTAVHYPRPLHHQPAYARYAAADACPHSLAAAARVLSLPMSADLTEAQQDQVVAALAAALG